MRINAKKLEERGFGVEWDAEEQELSIWSKRNDERALRTLKHAADRAGLNDRSTDELIGFTMELQVIQAIRD